MSEIPPSGAVTFVLTALEGSTRLWEQDPDAMKIAMGRHDELLENAIDEHRGFVFSRMGDGLAAAFPTAMDAVSAAAAIQQALAGEHWDTPRPLKARVGLQSHAVTPMGAVLALPTARVIDLAEASKQPGFPRVLIVGPC